MKNKIQLEQELFKVEELEVVKHIVVGIYNIEKVEQASDYFFDSPQQLIATLSEKSKEYKMFIKTKILQKPIEKYSFKPLKETFEEYFICEKEANKYLEINIEAEKEKAISDLLETIEQAKEDINVAKDILKKYE